MSKLVAGVDSSTQSTKVVVVDTASGRVVAQGRAGHEVTGEGGARESSPERWWDALAAALAETGLAGSIDAIAVAGQQHGLVLVDDTGTAHAPAMLWNDVRSAGEAEWLVQALGGPDIWAEMVGVVPVASFTATKWLWTRRHAPERLEGVAGAMLPHDFLTARCVGEAVTDRGDASGTAWWSTKTESYVDRVLDLIGLDPALLPRVVPGDEPAGVVRRSVADTLGLRAGIPVGAGTGDNMGAALALGGGWGRPVMSLGTSGTVYARVPDRIVDPSGTLAGFAAADAGFLPLAATLNCTQVVDRVAEWLGIDRGVVADDTSVVMLPYFDGERTPNRPDAAGLILGLRHTTTPGEILLAAYQGAVAGLLDALDLIGEHAGLDDGPLVLVGGGAAGPVWQRTVADLSGRPVVVPDQTELVAIGAAAQAAGLLEGADTTEITARWGVTDGRTIEPGGTGADERDRRRQVIAGIESTVGRLS